LLVDRNDSSENVNAFEINAPYVTLTTARGSRHPELPESFAKIVGASAGVKVNAAHAVISRLEIIAVDYGLFVANDHATLRNLLIRGGSWQIRMFLTKLAVIENCTLHNSRVAGLYFQDAADATVRNNVFVDNPPQIPCRTGLRQAGRGADCAGTSRGSG
jgi:parallel beta-helix repeat protein